MVLVFCRKLTKKILTLTTPLVAGKLHDDKVFLPDVACMLQSDIFSLKL